MRIDRILPVRNKPGRVTVHFEDSSLLQLTEQEVLDFGLRPGDEPDEATLARMKEAAGRSGARITAAELVGKRAMSRRELERKLRDKGASEAEARYAAEWLEAIGAIDDAAYAAALVRHHGAQGYGPGWIREKLREKGVSRDLWEEALEQLPPPEEHIDRWLERRWKGAAPDPAEVKRAAAALVRRGFSWSDVRSAMTRYTDDLPED